MIALVLAWMLAASFCLWRVGRRVRFFLHVLQLEGYKSASYAHWIRTSGLDAVLRPSHGVGFLLLVAGAALAFVDGVGQSLLAQSVFLVVWAAAFSSSRRYRRDRPKKPIAFTPRMRRMASVTMALLAIPVVLGLLFVGRTTGLFADLAVLAGLFVADLITPFAIRMASMLMAPVERHIHEGFKSRARSRLVERTDLRIVGITGSYGKTSVKFAVREVLSQRFPVLATPGSFNTPMGISKVINDDLRGDHAVLVLEMGIRHPGDIDELCDIARPDMAVVTSVGIAHLETMGSIEAIAREKGSILDHLKPGGTAVLNGDDPRVRQMAEHLNHRVIMVSTGGLPSADLLASNIEYNMDGARFDVSDGSSAAPVSFKTMLLGRHNVLNILLALGVGSANGLRLRQMKHAVSRLEPVEHRLKLRMETGVAVLDDAFNSNPVGAANALEVLGAFSTGNRYVVTPGMIELGEREEEENRAFGGKMARHTDWAVLVGPDRTKPIARGLLEGGFPTERIQVVRSLFEARDWLAERLQPGDAVLYENDLPDQFNEA